jgi:hypothetical protein
MNRLFWCDSSYPLPVPVFLKEVSLLIYALCLWKKTKVLNKGQGLPA